jgi:hypothetical protein
VRIIVWVVIALIAVTGLLLIFRGHVSIFAFAGPWERWEKGDVEGDEVWSAVIGAAKAQLCSTSDALPNAPDLTPNESHLSEEAERRERRCPGTVLVWNNRETEMASLVEVEPLFFALVGGPPGAEGVLLNEDLAIHSASILRDFHAHLLGALAHCLFDFVDESRDGLRMIEFHYDLLDHVGAGTDPTRGSGAGASVQQVFDWVGRML